MSILFITKRDTLYDARTGEIRDDRNHMSMLEDFWLPRREGGRGTEITTLPGGSNLGEIDDIKYFQTKLYRSLNVPISRLEAENSFSIGRSDNITRDELKFTKFVQSKEYVLKRVLNMNDSEIAEMRDQIRKELDTDPLEGGVDMPDGGDGITRYPQDGSGGVISPEEMPDYEDPDQDGIPSDDEGDEQ
jgi:hypothetical protein